MRFRNHTEEQEFLETMICWLEGLRVCVSLSVQRFRDLEIQRFRDFRDLRDSEIQRFRDSEIQGFKDSRDLEI